MFAHRFEPQGRRFGNVHYYYYHISACVQTCLFRQTHWLFKHHCKRQQARTTCQCCFPKQRSSGLGLYSWKREFQHTFGCLGHSACLSGRSYFGVKTRCQLKSRLSGSALSNCPITALLVEYSPKCALGTESI